MKWLYELLVASLLTGHQYTQENGRTEEDTKTLCALLPLLENKEQTNSMYFFFISLNRKQGDRSTVVAKLLSVLQHNAGENPNSNVGQPSVQTLPAEGWRKLSSKLQKHFDITVSLKLA